MKHYWVNHDGGNDDLNVWVDYANMWYKRFVYIFENDFNVRIMMCEMCWLPIVVAIKRVSNVVFGVDDIIRWDMI